MATFPILTMTQDSKHYSVELEDPSLKTEMDGGYVVSRAKHTRKPRRTFTTGFTEIGNADRLLLENFYDLVRGSSNVFQWTDPVALQVFNVRFSGKLNFKYVGIGGFHRWDVTFALEQA